MGQVFNPVNFGSLLLHENLEKIKDLLLFCSMSGGSKASAVVTANKVIKYVPVRLRGKEIPCFRLKLH